MDRRLTKKMLIGVEAEEILVRGDICDEDLIKDMLGSWEDIDTEENILQNEESCFTSHIGGTKLYRTFSRNNGGVPYHYAGLCRLGEDKNLHPKPGKKVYIISQYHAATEEGMEFNARFAQALARKIMTEHGDIPVAPHIYFTTFCADVGWERDFGIEAGHLMMESCDSVLIAPIDQRLSQGMVSDLEYATLQLGLKPEVKNFTRAEAEEFVAEMERDKYEEWNRAEHR